MEIPLRGQNLVEYSLQEQQLKSSTYKIFLQLDSLLQTLQISCLPFYHSDLKTSTKRIFSMNSLFAQTRNSSTLKNLLQEFVVVNLIIKDFSLQLTRRFSQLSTRREGTWFSLKAQCVATIYLQNNRAKYRLGTQSKVKDLVGNSSPNGKKKKRLDSRFPQSHTNEPRTNDRRSIEFLQYFA